MTEGQRVFYKRRMREELNKARTAPEPYLRDLHLRWAGLYEQRLDGMPKTRVALPE